MSYIPSRALELLRLGTQNPNATFRDNQEDAIQHVVEGRGRLLVVQKTGWGKSAVYFIAAKLLREQGAGPAILISPLLSLMRNQIAAALRMGVRAVTIHSGNTDEWDAAEASLAGNEVDILLISPERLANDHFKNNILWPLANRISLLVVDEAHCISDWGHDFRPHYRLLERIIRLLPPNLRLLATTATANNRVLEDLQSVLGPNLSISRGDLNRPSLLLQTIIMPSQADRMAWLAACIPNIPGSGIVYTLLVRDAVQVAEWLRSQGIHAEAYTGQAGDRREELEEALLNNQVKLLVATTALGMGFDKPDLAFVIHFQSPSSVVAYYQQVGRAGRALPAAYGVLLAGSEDDGIADYFIESAFSTREEIEAVLAALEESEEALSIYDLMEVVNASKARIEKALLHLSLESPSPIAPQGGKWILAPVTLDESFWARANRLTTLRRAEQRQMQEYVRLNEGHMEFLINALDGDSTGIHGLALVPLPSVVRPDLVLQAIAFLRRTSLPIRPRRQWPPKGGLPQLGLRGNIRPEKQSQEGKALCVWGDSGWGVLVKSGKIQNRFPDELVVAAANLIRLWAPSPAPTWVTCVPSRRHPVVVPDFAQRLATALNLPFRAVLEQSNDRPEQKSMANNNQQARNVDGSIAVNTASVIAGPVLLVDDVVRSRWTFTLASYLLVTNGSGPVFPFALALVNHVE